MQLDEEKLKMIYEYFQPLYRVRGGDWITEIRRQVVVECKAAGVKHGMIAKLINIHHTAISNYIKRMIPRHDVMPIVAEYKDEWIVNKKYPLTAYRGSKQNKNFTYVLSDEPPLGNLVSIYISAEKKNDKLNSFIESL